MNAENVNTNEKKSVSRRALLKAGWVVPAIAITPLMNTASAMSTVNCTNMQSKLTKHINNGDYKAANDLLGKIIDSGCTY